MTSARQTGLTTHTFMKWGDETYRILKHAMERILKFGGLRPMRLWTSIKTGNFSILLVWSLQKYLPTQEMIHSYNGSRVDLGEYLGSCVAANENQARWRLCLLAPAGRYPLRKRGDSQIRRWTFSSDLNHVSKKCERKKQQKMLHC